MKAGQVGNAVTRNERMEAALVAARFEDDTRLCGEIGKPLHLRQIAELVGQRKDTMTDTPSAKFGVPNRSR